MTSTKCTEGATGYQSCKGAGWAQWATGTPTQRLIWVALFHLDGRRWNGRAAGLAASMLHDHVGGNWRTFEDSLRSLHRRGIIERHKDPDVGWMYLLKPEYAQWRFDKSTAAEKRFDPEGYADREKAFIASLKTGAVSDELL